mmetsp:Transcript_27622/g.40026  ORF Transcript_27622/g.40026 Transcript_27622/m.40026 type:complete len:261 (-) Transcript_27622:61-843(-)
MMWTAYKQLLAKHPLLTKACTSATMMSASDATIQTYETRDQTKLVHAFEQRYPTQIPNLQKGCPTFVQAPSPMNAMEQTQRDWKRTGDLAVTGLLYSGPISHAWYSVLEKVVKAKGRVVNVAIKMALDALLFSPVAVAGYFTVRTALEGGDANAVKNKLEKKWRDAYLASLTFWPLANVVNFAFVPLELRVFFNNCLSLLWNGFLSNLNSKRLETVVMDRGEHETHFQREKGGEKEEVSEAEKKASEMVCVCHHCKAVRA